MSYARITYDVSGTQYAVPFDYIDADYIHVYLGEDDTATEGTFTWVNESLVDITSSLAGVTKVSIYRETPITAKLVDFQDAAILTEEDLDNAFQQIFDNAQETRDIAEQQAGVTQAEVEQTLTDCEAARDAAQLAETNAETAETNAESAASAAAISAAAAQVSWRYGTGAPSAGLGIDGDNYTDTSNYDYYHKETGSWVLKGNLKGADGTGAGDFVGPASSTDGNFVLFNGATGKVGKDSGVKASDFATAGHNHTGTYEPADADIVKKDVANTFTAAQRATITTLTDGANIATDLSLSNNFKVTLGGNRTMDNPSNITAGQTGVLYVIQDATGSRTLSWGSYWCFASDTAPTLSTAANAVDVIAYSVRDTTHIDAVLSIKGSA
jgi:hypothetical protein